MAIPKIKKSIREKLDKVRCYNGNLPEEVEYPFSHELVCYGVQAVCISHVMKEAQQINQKKSLSKFLNKYKIRQWNQHLVFPISSVEKQGLYLPKAGHYSHPMPKSDERLIILFDRDYLNKTPLPSWKNKENAFEMIEGKWSCLDFKDKEFVDKGIMFGKNLWDVAKEGANELNNLTDQALLELDAVKYGKKLINYYDAIINK